MNAPSHPTDPTRALHVSVSVNVNVNGQRHALHPASTLADLIDALALASDRTATAVNGVFVARHQRPLHVLCDGDQVTCFQAIVGG